MMVREYSHAISRGRALPLAISGNENRLVYRQRLLRREAPTRGPVLGLHLVAPAECAGPIAEVSISQRTAVDEPYDDRSARTRTNHSVSRLAIGASHSPHDD